jgi:RimJ/RimL family protein N-acetyltransferase
LLRTERLLLRKPTAADVASPPAFLSDPEVMDWLGGPGDPSWMVQRWVDEWETFPAGKLVVELPEGGPIGRVGLNFYDPARWVRSAADDAVPELTWAIAREHWGNGYATEAARAVRDWFGTERRVVSLIEPRNSRSARVAAKLGCARTGEVALIDGVPCDVWRHPTG